MPLDSKYTEPSFLPNSTVLLLLQLAQMPRSPDWAISVSTKTAMTTTQPTVFYSLHMHVG